MALSNNPFAAPSTQLRQSTTSQVDNLWLVTARNPVLTKRCLQCGEPSDQSVQQRVSWHAPALYALLLAGLLPYIMVAASVKKRADIHVGLCESHWIAHRNRRRAWWASLAGSAMGLFAGMAWDNLILMMVMTGAVAVAGLGTYHGTPLLTPRLRKEGRTWFRGAHQDFLRHLPDHDPDKDAT